MQIPIQYKKLNNKLLNLLLEPEDFIVDPFHFIEEIKRGVWRTTRFIEMSPGWYTKLIFMHYWFPSLEPSDLFKWEQAFWLRMNSPQQYVQTLSNPKT
jgi:hypothetical protein